ASRRTPAVLGQGARIPGYALQSDLSPQIHLAQFQRPLPVVARGGEAGRRLQLLHPAAPDADAGGDGGALSRRQDRGRSSREAQSEGSRSVAGIQENVPAEALPASLDQRVGTVRAVADERVSI